MKSWEPMSPVVLSVRVLERDICVRAIFLDEGMSVLLAGGDKTHIGAVSIRSRDAALSLFAWRAIVRTASASAGRLRWAKRSIRRFVCNAAFIMII